MTGLCTSGEEIRGTEHTIHLVSRENREFKPETHMPLVAEDIPEVQRAW